jgi:predicted ArsR family transcriptional regulator
MRRDVFQAIADPTRRAIITLISLHAMTPNALAEHFDVTRQAVSKHLRILTECIDRAGAGRARDLLPLQPQEDERSRGFYLSFRQM